MRSRVAKRRVRATVRGPHVRARDFRLAENRWHLLLEAHGFGAQLVDLREALNVCEGAREEEHVSLKYREVWPHCVDDLRAGATLSGRFLTTNCLKTNHQVLE